MPRAMDQSLRVANIFSWPNRARSQAGSQNIRELAVSAKIGQARSTRHGFYLVPPSPQVGGSARAPPSSWRPSPTNRSTVSSSSPRSWTHTYECQPIHQDIQLKTRSFHSTRWSLPWNQLNLGRFPAAPPEREGKGRGGSQAWRSVIINKSGTWDGCEGPSYWLANLGVL